jgi:hypothetical protein
MTDINNSPPKEKMSKYKAEVTKSISQAGKAF